VVEVAHALPPSMTPGGSDEAGVGACCVGSAVGWVVGVELDGAAVAGGVGAGSPPLQAITRNTPTTSAANLVTLATLPWLDWSTAILPATDPPNHAAGGSRG
jgi:hypothetical protein